MEHVEYKPLGVCSKKIDFDIDDEGKLHNLHFQGGCSGNTKGISLLCEGMDAKEVAGRLAGNSCGPRPTSCPDQLAKAIQSALDRL